MTKKQLWLSGFLALALLLLVGCGHQPDASEQLQGYVNLWKKQDFTAMYGYLSDAAQKKISKKAFVARYEKIYQGIDAGNLTAVVKPSSDAHVMRLAAALATAAGTVRFAEHVRMQQEMRGGQKRWLIDWQPALILPGLSGNETIRAATDPATRGEILDVNGKPLAMDSDAMQVDLVPGQLGSGASRDQTIAQLTQMLGVTADQINAALRQRWVRADSLVPIKTLPASNADLARQATALPGVYRTKVTVRFYPDGAACAHLTGYVGKVTADFLKKHRGEGYTADSLVGQTGLEQIFEKQLRASDGAAIEIINKEGTVERTLARKRAKNGHNIQLTIDQTVQDALYNQLASNAGSAVAMNPQTGDVSALVSTPSYDPNAFAIGISSADYTKLSSDSNHPLLNRFTEATAPGSTFKVLTAALGLDSKTIDPNQEVAISGKSWQEGKAWGNYSVTRVDSAPSVNLAEALYRSDNIYFAQAALKIGADRFMTGGKKFGLGEAVPFPYPMQVSRLSANGKLTNHSTELADSGYGQGQVVTTPLYLSLIYSALVNQGSIVKPRLIKTTSAPQIWKKDVMSAQTAATISSDLAQVISNPDGTAHDAAITNLPLAGKTGTPEFKDKQGQSGRENGWFVAYNTENPQLLVTMMAENTQNLNGSHYLIPKMKAVFQQLLNP
ncbi:MAG: penicillin-binding transpeptidase domain-containing protein [Sporolactobacillus sp.]